MSIRSEIHFWHIPKTAGTSIAALIRRAFRPGEVIPAHTVRELIGIPRDDVPRYRCYTGHFFSLLEPLVGRPLPTVTILRDPVEQTLSLLRHCQRHVPGAGWVAPLVARSVPILWQKVPSLRLRIQRSWCPVLMNNFQTRVLGSDIRWPGKLDRDFYGLTYPFMEKTFCDPRANMENLFSRAVERIKAMAVVGTVERLPETVGCIAELLDITAPEVLPHENRSTRRSYPPPGFLKLIEDQNVYDRKLHRMAGELLDLKSNM